MPRPVSPKRGNAAKEEKIYFLCTPQSSGIMDLLKRKYASKVRLYVDGTIEFVIIITSRPRVHTCKNRHACANTEELLV